MKVDVSSREDGLCLTLLEPHLFVLELGDCTKTCIIPAGYRSDGCSIPRFFWRWLTPQIDPVTLEPSVEHDWLYGAMVCTRAEADAHYRRSLIAKGYPKRKAWLIWAALRAFGWTHWGEEEL